MFEKLSTLALQEYWWFLVALIGGLFVFLTFVQGGQTKLLRAASEDQKDLLVNALGRKWELTFTTLVMFGGALFAAFPLFYAVSFGGAYWLWFLILLSFIIQAVAYEYRKKPGNFLGQHTYEIFLLINGTAGIFLLGVALGSFFTGGAFVLDDMKRMEWLGSARGLEMLTNPFNLAFGVMLLFLARILGVLYFGFVLEDDELRRRLRRGMGRDVALFLLAFAYLLFELVRMDGVGYEGGRFFVEHGKYLHNLLDQPWLMGLFGVGVLLVLGGIVAGYTLRRYAFWLAGVGVVAVGMSLILLAGYDHTAFYPSTVDLRSSLTIQNASGSRVTLITMSYVSLMVPLVVGYIAYVWRLMDRGGLSQEEIENDTMHY